MTLNRDCRGSQQRASCIRTKMRDQKSSSCFGLVWARDPPDHLCDHSDPSVDGQTLLAGTRRRRDPPPGHPGMGRLGGHQFNGRHSWSPSSTNMFIVCRLTLKTQDCLWRIRAPGTCIEGSRPSRCTACQCMRSGTPAGPPAGRKRQAHACASAHQARHSGTDKHPIPVTAGTADVMSLLRCDCPASVPLCSSSRAWKIELRPGSSMS